jgi:hypothetical protein
VSLESPSQEPSTATAATKQAMSAVKDQVFEDWRPLGQSLTLVRAPISRVALAFEQEGVRLSEYICGGADRFAWVRHASIADLFQSVKKFTVSPTVHYAIPTKTDWTVVWDNGSACDGHSSFAHCLTRFYKLETISFRSSDRDSIMRAGSHFTHGKAGAGAEPVERHVYCCNVGARWEFRERGERLPEEDAGCYSRKRKRERLDEEGMMELLVRFGIHPWREATYDFQARCFRMLHSKLFESSEAIAFEQIRDRAQTSAREQKETRCSRNEVEGDDLKGPPNYLRGTCKRAAKSGPARLLADGKWCGHGEENFWLYDIAANDESHFMLQLPNGDGPLVVRVVRQSGGPAFPIYDSRRHPANLYYESQEPPAFRPVEVCSKCGSTLFRMAVGFEVPLDAESANDTSWFALATECAGCGLTRIAFDDETV